MKRELNNLARIISSQLEVVPSDNLLLVQQDTTHDDNRTKHYTILTELNNTNDNSIVSSSYHFEPITFLPGKDQKSISNDLRQRQKTENSKTASGTQKPYKYNKQS